MNSFSPDQILFEDNHLIAINKPKFLFKYFYNKVNASYSKWFMNDHYVSIEEIIETKIKAINILKNENII